MDKPNKYWGHQKARTNEPLAALLRNSEPFHTVTHRAIGDIPGCIPAVDVFVEHSLEDMKVYTTKRAEQFSNAVQTYIAAEKKIGGDGEKEMWFEGTRINPRNPPPIFIRNPAKKLVWGKKVSEG